MTDETILRVLNKWIEELKTGNEADNHIAMFFIGLRDRFVELTEGKQC